MNNKENQEENLEELFAKGDIIPYQVIYDVSFKPVFKIKTKLGLIADQLKKYYNTTEIQRDKSINSEEVIIFSRENLQTIFSFVYFRVIETPLRGKDFNLNQIKGEINNFCQKASQYLKDIEISRIGIRFNYLGSIDKNERLKKLNELDVFENLLKAVDCENSKIALFKFHVFPEPKVEETIIQLLGGSNYHIDDVDYEFEKAALIDCIKGYFNPPNIDTEYLVKAHEYMQKTILRFLSGKVD